jgi:AraC family transcriptional regulator
MLLPAGSRQNAAAVDGEAYTRSLALRVDPEWLEELVGPSANTLAHRGRSIYELRNNNIEQAMRRIFSEVLAPGPMTPLVIKSCSTLIAVELTSQIDDDASRCSSDIRSVMRTRQIEDYIQNYGDGWPSQGEIADSLGISVGYMRQVYSSTAGRSLFGYMEEVRMVRARALLIDRRVPLKIVAHRLGYSTHSAFSSAFRRETGVTPREYRTTAFATPLPASSSSH